MEYNTSLLIYNKHLVVVKMSGPTSIPAHTPKTKKELPRENRKMRSISCSLGLHTKLNGLTSNFWCYEKLAEAPLEICSLLACSAFVTQKS